MAQLIPFLVIFLQFLEANLYIDGVQLFELLCQQWSKCVLEFEGRLEEQLSHLDALRVNILYIVNINDTGAGRRRQQWLEEEVH